MTRYFSLDYAGFHSAELERRYPPGCPPDLTWACSGCGSMALDPPLTPVRLGHIPIGPHPITSSVSAPGHFVRRAFLEAVCGGEVERHFDFATVEAPDGRPHEDWLIVRGRNKVVIRGNDLPFYRYCATCGTLLYVARNGAFLYPPPLGDVDIFVANYGLVVTLRVLPRILERRWPHLEITELELPDEPPDGYGELPCRLDPDEVRRNGLDEFVGMPDYPLNLDL